MTDGRVATWRHPAALAVITVLALIGVWSLPTTQAEAATSGGRYAALSTTGGAGTFEGTVDLGLGFPVVTLSSTTTTTATVVSGASAWLPADTPFGLAYGSSRGQQYINIGPGGSPATTPSATTVYTFAAPTPAGTWAVNFGDIDAETLVISALGADGSTPVPAASLGLQTPYNYCDSAAPAPACRANTPRSTPVTTTDPTTVSASNPQCPIDQAAGQCDTQGAAVWLQPTVPISSLTVVSTKKPLTGPPTYQTWFATQLAGISGTLTAECPILGPSTVQLLSNAGAVIASTTADAAGAYAFEDLSAARQYEVRVDPASLAADQSSTPTTVAPALGPTTGADLTVACVFDITGTVTDAGGDPAPNVPVILTPAAGGAPSTVTTDATGTYTFPGVAPGTYVVAPQPGAGQQVTPVTVTVTVSNVDLTVPAFTVRAAAQPTVAPPPAQGGGAQLAATGYPVSWGIGAGAGAIVVGVGLVLAGRRRLR